MSLIPQMSVEEVRSNVDKMIGMMDGWGYGIATLGTHHHATLYHETVEYQGGFIRYGWIPVTSQRFNSYFDALSFCLNSLFNAKKEIETALQVAGEKIENGA